MNLNNFYIKVIVPTFLTGVNQAVAQQQAEVAADLTQEAQRRSARLSTEGGTEGHRSLSPPRRRQRATTTTQEEPEVPLSQESHSSQGSDVIPGSWGQPTPSTSSRR